MCLPPQFGLEPTVHQSLPRQSKHQPQQQQQQQQAVPLEVSAPIVCKPDPLYQVQQPVAFDFQTFDPLNAFDFNTNFILPCDDETLFAESCDDILAPTWPLSTTLEDLILPGEQPQLFGADDLSSFFSDASSSKSFTSLSPSFSSSEDSGFAPAPADVKPAVANLDKKRKARKRRLACDLNPTELARTREVNRIAAQRHRRLLKCKRSEQETKFAELCRKNTELRDTLRTLTAESRALTRIVVDIFAPQLGVSAAQQWNNQQMNSFTPSFPTSQPQVFC